MHGKSERPRWTTLPYYIVAHHLDTISKSTLKARPFVKIFKEPFIRETFRRQLHYRLAGPPEIKALYEPNSKLPWCAYATSVSKWLREEQTTEGSQDEIQEDGLIQPKMNARHEGRHSISSLYDTTDDENENEVIQDRDEEEAEMETEEEVTEYVSDDDEVEEQEQEQEQLDEYSMLQDNHAADVNTDSDDVDYFLPQASRTHIPTIAMSISEPQRESTPHVLFISSTKLEGTKTAFSNKSKDRHIIFVPVGSDFVGTFGEKDDSEAKTQSNCVSNLNALQTDDTSSSVEQDEVSPSGSSEGTKLKRWRSEAVHTPRKKPKLHDQQPLLIDRQRPLLKEHSNQEQVLDEEFSVKRPKFVAIQNHRIECRPIQSIISRCVNWPAVFCDTNVICIEEGGSVWCYVPRQETTIDIQQFNMLLQIAFEPASVTNYTLEHLFGLLKLSDQLGHVEIHCRLIEHVLKGTEQIASNYLSNWNPLVILQIGMAYEVDDLVVRALLKQLRIACGVLEPTTSPSWLPAESLSITLGMDIAKVSGMALKLLASQRCRVVELQSRECRAMLHPFHCTERDITSVWQNAVNEQTISRCSGDLGFFFRRMGRLKLDSNSRICQSCVKQWKEILETSYLAFQGKLVEWARKPERLSEKVTKGRLEDEAYSLVKRLVHKDS